jgi:ABC-type nickel/cobalt efflux system permease component RcnA
VVECLPSKDEALSLVAIPSNQHTHTHARTHAHTHTHTPQSPTSTEPTQESTKWEVMRLMSLCISLGATPAGRASP